MNMTLRWGRVSQLAAYSNTENTAIGKGTSPAGPSTVGLFVPQSALFKSEGGGDLSEVGLRSIGD